MTWRPLKHFCDGPPQYGLNISASDYAETGIRLLRTTDIQDDGTLATESGAVFVRSAVVEPRYTLHEGDLLFSRSGSLGKCLRISDAAAPMTFAGYLVRFRPRPDVIPRYLEYCASAKFFQSAIDADAITSTISNFNAERYGNLSVPDLQATEQQTVVDFLDTETSRIDALITKKRRMIALSDERKASILLSAVSGHLTQRGSFESAALAWMDDRPVHWREVLVRLVATTGSGHTPSRDHPDWWRDCTIPWITTGEVAALRSDEVEWINDTREKISELGLENSAAVVHPAGTVVLCRTASAGYSGIMATSMATSQDFATWTCGSLLRPRFLLLCLRAMRPDLLGRLAMGSTHKTIYMPDLHALHIPLPPIHEQDAIVGVAEKRLQELFAVRHRIDAQIALLRERRQSLITAAVTGDLEIPGVAA